MTFFFHCDGWHPRLEGWFCPPCLPMQGISRQSSLFENRHLNQYSLQGRAFVRSKFGSVKGETCTGD